MGGNVPNTKVYEVNRTGEAPCGPLCCRIKPWSSFKSWGWELSSVLCLVIFARWAGVLLCQAGIVGIGIVKKQVLGLERWLSS